MDFHEFVTNLSQTAMFDEYLRSKIKSMGIQVLHNNGTNMRLRRRRLITKFVTVNIPPPGSFVVRPFKFTQRRITLPRTNLGSNRRRKTAGQKRRVSAL